MKVSDYIANFIVDRGIDHLFTVVGGGAMFLNDSFGHKRGLSVIYHHHEQAAAMAAEGYSRTKGTPSAVCITSGPGGTNALTGCLCAFTGSIPVLFFSGQVRYATSVPSTGLDLRQMGFQEFQIVNVVKNMTKYAHLIVDPNNIRYELEKALFIATHGRPGPIWLDIPLDVQNAMIVTKNLKGFEIHQEIRNESSIPEQIINETYEKLITSKRPVILLGKGLRFSGGLPVFKKFVNKLQIPVVTGMSSVDSMETDNPVYVGRAGITGDRAGNFAVQNSDLLISIGNRLSFPQIGYNYREWAREAYKIVLDIDPEELKKPIVNIDLPIFGDAKEFVERLYEKSRKKNDWHGFKSWLDICEEWKVKYPVVNRKQSSVDKSINIYTFYDTLTRLLNPGDVMVVSAGTARVVGSQAAIIKEGQRFISNSSTASMGYGLPAAIGACYAIEKKSIICITGDGSLQMNIQELQTIKQNNLPIKIFVINNGGYHSIRMTQKAYFPDHSHIGVGEDSGDLSFPDLSKIAAAYGFPYFSCCKNEELIETIKICLNTKSSLICEIFVSKEQSVEPKASSKKLVDGSFVSAPLEDMAPFLPREELKQIMLIPMVDEDFGEN